MRLRDFITANLDPILTDWVAFARRQTPASTTLDDTALLDHGRSILEGIAANMQRPQDEAERRAKSVGDGADASTASDVPSRSHARQRERQGFNIVQMISEYRALRATVLRVWSAASAAPQAEDLEDVSRFNEAVDQALAESVEVFALEVARTRDLFLGVLSHDLRGPLSTIASAAEVTRRTTPDSARAMAIVARSASQMKSLLDDLLEYTRHRLGGGLAVFPTPLDLGDFVRDTLEEIGAVSPGRTLRFEATGDLRGTLDSRRLHQALSNLVFNALKYGFPSSEVRVGVDGAAPGEVVLVVENAGKSIPPGLLTRLFDPLVRADDDTRGTDTQVAGANLGLGLYVVREIAVAHGGSVSVTSDSALTRFTLRLPRVAVGTGMARETDVSAGEPAAR